MSNSSLDLAVPGPTGSKRAGHHADTVVDAYPLTPMQQAMLLHGQRDPLAGLYVQQYVCTLREPLDLPVFRGAWQRLVLRHPVLRTSFLLDASPEPLQRVHPAVELPWTEHDWRGLTAGAQEEALRDFLGDDRSTPFRPERAPLARFTLFRLEDDAYRLVWTSHHALMDGHARRILLREVFEDYEARMGGQVLAAAEQRSFGEYVRWLHRAELPDSRTFWKEEMRGFEAPNELVLEGGAGGESVRRERYGFALPEELTAALHHLARREEVTLNTVLQCAWAFLLGRYTGDGDVVFGVTRSCRRSGFAAVDAVVGLLSNTVPVRVRLDMGRSVAHHLREVRSLWVRMRPHERTHVVRIQEWSAVPGGTPLFGTVLGFETETTQEALHRLGAGWRRRTFDLVQWTSYPLAVVAHGGDRVDLAVVYDPARFGREAIRRMGEHLTRVLRAFAEDPEQPLARVEMLDPAELSHLVEGPSPPPAPYAGPGCVHELFQAQADRTPGAAAVVCRGEVLAYGELERRSNRLAHLLRARGVRPDTRVGVCLERTPELVVALLGVLKAGGAYLPLDPGYPRERLGYMVADAEARLVLTTAALAERLPAGAEPLRLDALGGALAREPGTPPRAGARGENLSHVIFTSGSTGRPKGVMIRHSSVAVLLHWLRETVPDEERSSVLFSTSINFDVSVAEIFGTLCWGGTLVLVEDPLQLAAVPAEEGIRYASMVPTAAAELLRSGGIPSSVRTLNLGGEPLPPDLARGLYERTAVRRVGNCYGPTEDTTYSTFSLVDRDAARVTVGRPLPGTRAYVLDAHLRPLQVAVAGELYLAGEGLARGYAGRPELTAERFLPDPFGAPGARMYRTGDRARRLPTEELDYLGRLDEQVKVRGFRIEPGEVAAVLREHPAVGECVVAVREDQPGDGRLVGYVVAAEGAAAPSAAELRAHAGTRLPAHMVPSAFVALERLPLTASGKTDLRALPAPERTAEGDHVAPRTPVEEVLAGLFAGVLGLERIGVRDDFFFLGGHSLLTTRLAVRVREALGVELPLHAVFDAPTVEELARAVEALRAGGRGAADAPPLRPARRDGPLPLSFGQERLWFVQRLDPASAAYNVRVFRRLEGPLDAAALERALGEVVRRHEALRTVFAEVDGSPAQVVAPFGGWALPVQDLSGLGAPERGAVAARRAAEEGARPFDLSSGPLFRAALLRLGPEEHVLLLCMHHIVSDGWSTGVLLQELSALYGAYRTGSESPLPELPVQYADYAAWHREHLSGDRLERQLGYWRDRLAGAAEVLELPTDRPRPAVRTHRGSHERIELNGGLPERLRALGRSEGATPFMVLLGAFQALLSRYGGSGDVVVGSPVAGRTRRELEGLIGFFVNTLVLRTDLGGDPGFREVLRRVRETTLGAYDHQDVPFERLVAELRPERGPGHSPLVQVTFALEDAGFSAGGLPGLRVGGIERESGTAKFDLSLSLEATARGLAGGLTYSTDLFEPGTIRRMAGHLRRVLEQVAADADARLGGLELMDEPERRQVLEAWSGTTAELPRGSVHDLFAEQAALTPDAPAVGSAGRVLTYAELARRSARLAHHLAALGVRPESRVALCMERSPEMVVGMLAVLRAGGAYVPVDAGAPPERVREVLADAGCVQLLTHAAWTGHLPERLPGGAAPVRLDDAGTDAVLRRLPDTAPSAASDPEQLACVVYTSGSTGRPKGVAVPHRAVVRLVRDTDYARFGPTERVAQFSNPAFDAATFEIWGALLGGGTLVVPPAGTHSLEEMGAVLREQGITTLWLTAGLFHRMVDGNLEGLAGLRQLLAGGDVLSPAHVRRVREAFPELRLINGYGPTENTTFTCCHTVVEPVGAGATIPIGRPVRGTRVYVVDAHGAAAPAGVAGELHAAGTGVARGYLGDPAQTAEKFAPDPFSGVPGARLYRTGDRVRWLPDGTLEFLGRADQQVKVRGFRIEPGEIEAALESHPRVREAVVVAREDIPGERRLVAYVVPGGELAGAELRASLRERLPEYMVPGAYVVLDRLPLNANGKVDRGALPAPEAWGEEAPYEAPRTAVEEIVAGIWAEVLGRDRVGVRDDFFELGGHSLLATRVVSRLRRALGTEVPLRALFEASSLEALAGRVEALRRAGTARPVPPVARVTRAGPLPLSFAQQRLWLLQKLEPGSAAYNVPYALRLRGVVEAWALERSLTRVVERHEALRTRLLEINGRAVQVVYPPAPVRLPRVDLRRLAADDREREALRLAQAEALRPFDLARDPLLRGALLRLDEAERVLCLTLHHVVSDGWSMGVLFRELSALYAAYSRGEEPALAELPVQYADFAAWQRACLAGEALEERLAYWRARLAGAPPLLEIPTDRPRTPGLGARGAVLPLVLSAETSRGLRALGRGEGATLFMVLLAAWQVLLSRYSGQDDVVVGTPVSGRTTVEVEGLIGFFVNTLVLRADVSPGASFRELLGRVRETTLGAYQHQDLPFERLVEELQPERSQAHTSLFQVMFSLQSGEAGELRLGGADLEPLGRSPVVKFDLTLSLADAGEEIRGELAYRLDLWDGGSMERLLEHFRFLASRLAAAPDRRLADVPLLGAAERARVLEEWNAPAVDGPRACVHELFAAQARRTPDAAAVSWRGARTSYAELDRRSDRLAHALRRRGVGPEVRVGVCMDRTPELPAAILGVLKAGGAYVPLDPAYPQARLGRMLEDAGIGLVVTEPHLAGRLPRGAADLLLADAASGEPGTPVESGALPENLSHVIFTSGSTGRPKGVMIRHSSVAVLLHWLRETVPDEERSSVLFSTSINFDVSVAEIFGTLCWGGMLVLVENALELASADEPVACASMVPTAAAELLRSGGIPASVRTLNLGGEALPPALARGLYGLGHVEKVRNLYGPTEDTTYSTCSLVRNGAEQVLVGRTLPGTRAYVLDPGLQPVPVGVAGEMHLAGDGLARGYAGRPDLTAERFVPDPFGPPGSRMYRVMDRVRWRADGELEYLGRLDQQVKVRGFRVEPAEVEAALQSHPQVREAVVVAREDTPGERRLVAYVVPRGGGGAAGGELRTHLRERLPEYMVPAAFVALDALPLTPNGKLDRRALPAPEWGGDGERFVAPRTATEELLADIWTEVLEPGEGSRIGACDNFFELGGHSLLAAQVIARVRQVFGVELPFGALFEAPTVGGLAATVDASVGAGVEEWELEEEMQRLEGLSDREVHALLRAAPRPTPGGGR
jgi:amino acid adenylation domain-containing protein